MICDCSIAFSNTSTESTISDALIFLNTFVITFAPALSNAFALSYSQFVPGITGINTVGCAILWLQIQISDVSYNPVSTFSSCPSAPELVGNTFSSVSSHADTASSNAIFTSLYSIAALSVTSPITVQVIPSSDTLSAGTSAMISPNAGANKSLASTLCSIFTPMPLPKAILLTAAAIPCLSNA